MKSDFTLGASVRAELARRGLSQTSLAEHLGLSQAAVHRRIAGDVEFTVSQIKATAAFLEPVTIQENLRRRHAAVTHCRRGHEFTPSNTYRRARGSRECITCRYKRWASSLGRPVKPIGRPRKEAVAS